MLEQCSGALTLLKGCLSSKRKAERAHQMQKCQEIAVLKVAMHDLGKLGDETSFGQTICTKWFLPLELQHCLQPQGQAFCDAGHYLSDFPSTPF